MELKDKVVIVTGAAQGLGRQFALDCAANGMKVALADIDPDVLEEYIATANNPEYNNDFSIINSKFPEFNAISLYALYSVTPCRLATLLNCVFENIILIVDVEARGLLGTVKDT